MSCFDVQILDPNINTIEIETCIGDQPSSIDILTYDNTSIVEVNHCIPLLSEIVDILPVQDILSGSGISVSDNSGIYTISLSNPTIYSSGIVDFLEAVQDVIGNSGLVAGNYINVNYNDSTGYTTISAAGLQPSGNYSVVGHTHLSSDITDFSSSVSGLLPVKNISAGSGIGISSLSGDFTVTVTGTFGLTAEEVDDRVSNLLVGGNYVNINYNDNLNQLTISTTGLQPSGNYSLVGHTHTSSNITDFVSSVSGLLPTVTGTGYINSSFNNNIYTIDVSGLQPSGNYSLIGHTHNSSDILDFNTTVSGLLPNTYDAAVPWTVNHTLVDGTRYLAGDLVYENGRLYKANYDNESIPVSSTLYWTDVGPGYRLNIDGRDIPNIPYPVTSVNGHSGVVELSTLDLDDFNSAVSGLIPPSNFTSLTGLSGIIVSNSGTDYYVSLSDPTIQLNDITDLSSDARTFLLTSSSDNLRTLISDETGSGTLVFNNSPAFSGIPTVPTAPSGTNTNQIASTSFVRTEISNLVDSAPSTLDTLNELAAALGDDPNFATTITNSLANKANLSGAIFTGSVTIPSGTGNFNSLTVNGTGVSVSGHTHTSSNITDFNSSVSGLLPSVSGSGYVSSSFNNNTYTISVSGLQPSGNYSTVGHTHTSSDITDFNSSVSGLLPSVTGTGYVSSSFSNNAYTISVSGLQPSGDYSINGHTHSSVDITDFNSAVSGLLPVKDIVGGSGIQVGSSSGIYTLTVTGDIVAASASSLITEVYNNTASTIPKMSVVYINGGHGNLPTISLGIANGEAGSSKTYGITAENILPNSNGDVVVLGSLIDVDTNQFGVVEGTTLYLSPSTSGALTTTKPLAPNHLVTVGKIVRNHNNQGVIQVAIQNGFELGELHNVSTNGSGDNGKFLQYNSSSGLWVSSSSGNFTTLQVNETGVVASSGGNSGYLSKFTASNTIDNSIIYQSGSNVGINTTAPSGYLDVAGDVYVRGTGNNLGTVYIKSSASTDTSLKIRADSQGNLFLDAGGAYIKAGNQDGTAMVQGYTGPVTIGHISNSNSNQNIIFKPRNTERARLTHDGNFGIGTSTPSSQLHVIGTGNFSQNLLVNGTGVSLVGHTHTSSNITDFNSSVSGLLPSITGTGYVNTSFSSNIYTISVTGLQPSGNYANAIHTHSSSEITDFNSSVSGLLPTISNSGDNRLLTSTGSSVGINAENNLTFDGSTLNVDGNLVFDSFTESVVAIGNSSTSQTLSLASGTVQTCTLTDNCTFTMPTATAGKSFTMFLNSGSGNYTASFSGVLWSDSAPPTITTTASKVDILSFISDGTYWYGSYSQNYG